MDSKILIFEDPEEFLSFMEELQEDYISTSTNKKLIYMKNNSYLHLLIWLLEHTELTEELNASGNELKEHYLKEDVPEVVNLKVINSKIGSFLFIIYGTSLKKSEDNPRQYNIKYSDKPVRTVLIGGYYE